MGLGGAPWERASILGFLEEGAVPPERQQHAARERLAHEGLGHKQARGGCREGSEWPAHIGRSDSGQWLCSTCLQRCDRHLLGTRRRENSSPFGYSRTAGPGGCSSASLAQQEMRWGVNGAQHSKGHSGKPDRAGDVRTEREDPTDATRSASQRLRGEILGSRGWKAFRADSGSPVSAKDERQMSRPLARAEGQRWADQPPGLQSHSRTADEHVFRAQKCSRAQHPAHTQEIWGTHFRQERD